MMNNKNEKSFTRWYTGQFQIQIFWVIVLKLYLSSKPKKVSDTNSKMVTGTQNTQWTSLESKLHFHTICGSKKASNRHMHQHTFTHMYPHPEAENNLQFKGLTWVKGHILSQSSQRRSSLTPFEEGSYIMVGSPACQMKTLCNKDHPSCLFLCVCACVCGWVLRPWGGGHQHLQSGSFPHPGLFYCVRHFSSQSWYNVKYHAFMYLCVCVCVCVCVCAI